MRWFHLSSGKSFNLEKKSRKIGKSLPHNKLLENIHMDERAKKIEFVLIYHSCYVTQRTCAKRFQYAIFTYDTARLLKAQQKKKPIRLKHDILSWRYVVLLISAPFMKKKLFRLVSSQANRFRASEIMSEQHNVDEMWCS